MALRDWQPWHIATMWVVGVAVLWLILRGAVAAFSGSSSTGGMSGVGVPVLPGLMAIAVLVVLVAVTIGWMRRAG